MSNARKSRTTDLQPSEQNASSPAPVQEPADQRASKRAKKLDYGVTIKILYGAAILLAVAAFVIIGLKTVEDLTAEQSASTLLSAYKDLEMVTVQPTATPSAAATPETTAEATATPSISPGVDTDELASTHRVDADSDLVVDETADYVQPDDAATAETAEIIKQIVSAVGDDGVIGTIEIPKTEQEYPIIGKWSYRLLKISICRYQGGLPNEFGSNLVLIGHNYKSGAHFGNLKKLEIGDEIYLTAKGGERTRYVVYEKKGISPDAFDELKQYRGESGLTLLTCKDNGNNRLIVRCEQKAVESSVSAGRAANVSNN